MNISIKINGTNVNNLKKSAKENFYVSINESLAEFTNTNSKHYRKTIKMVINGERQSSENPHYVVQTRTTQVHWTIQTNATCLTITSVP
jgi:hypothetical protein